MEKLFERLTAKMDADRKADQEKAEADRVEGRVGQEKLLKEMKAWREEMAAMRNKWVNNNHNETMACQEIEARPEEEKEPTPVNTKPEVAQQDEFLAENAKVMPVGEPKKKRRREGGRPLHKVQFLVWDLLEIFTVCCQIFSLGVFLRVLLAVLSFLGCSLRLVCSSFTPMLHSSFSRRLLPNVSNRSCT
jgi:hypothetical protein